jgi:hypothetical protein
MPYIIRPRQMRNIAAAVLSSALLLGAVPALASAACPSSSTSHAFAQLGDNASYSLVQGGTFASTQGWSLHRASVISDGSIPMGGSHALAINNGSAISPGFCVSEEYPTYRFLFRLLHGGGPLSLGLRWTDQDGSHDVSVGSTSTGSSWTLSPVLALASNLTMGPDGTLTPVQLVFETKHPGLEYAIADVYVDPYSR